MCILFHERAKALGGNPSRRRWSASGGDPLLPYEALASRSSAARLWPRCCIALAHGPSALGARASLTRASTAPALRARPGSNASSRLRVRCATFDAYHRPCPSACRRPTLVSTLMSLSTYVSLCPLVCLTSDQSRHSPRCSGPAGSVAQRRGSRACSARCDAIAANATPGRC